MILGRSSLGAAIVKELVRSEQETAVRTHIRKRMIIESLGSGIIVTTFILPYFTLQLGIPNLYRQIRTPTYELFSVRTVNGREICKLTAICR